MDERLEDHMRRYEKPDGYCLHCQQPANQYYPVGPITITISDPYDARTHEFCNWECFGRWAAAQAGFEGYRTPEVAWSHQRWP